MLYNYLQLFLLVYNLVVTIITDTIFCSTTQAAIYADNNNEVMLVAESLMESCSIGANAADFMFRKIWRISECGKLSDALLCLNMLKQELEELVILLDLYMEKIA